MYDPSNIFAKIIRREIPAKVHYESETALVFHDVNPKAKVHLLAIPKVEVCDFEQFSELDSDKIGAFFKEIREVASLVKTQQGFDGFKLQINNGAPAQEVFHFHVHILFF